jgi:hypothetical protein
LKKTIIFLAVFLFANPISIINGYRNAVGLNLLKENPSLTLAAKLHAKYMFKNNEFSHIERKYGYRFAGVTPAERAMSCGYPSRYVIENISKGEKSYKESIKDLFSAIYHRLAFLNFNINEIGCYSLNGIYVYDMGNKYICEACNNFEKFNSGLAGLCRDKNKIIPKEVYIANMQNNPKIVFWPYNGMKGTPPVFYEETPDPLPDYGVCGYPVSISFNPYYYKNKKIQLITFNLYKGKTIVNNVRIITSENDVNHMLKKTDFVLFPLQRLQYGARYSVEADFVIDGKIKSYKWSFEIENKQMPVITVVSNSGKYFIKPNVTYLIYFKPLNGNDKLSDLKYEFKRGLTINKIGYKDANTLYLNVSGANNKKLEIFAKNRHITLIIRD